MSSKDWLVISVITFLTVAGWVVYDIHHAAILSTITPLQKDMIEPLNPTFDTDTLSTLKLREE